MNKHPKLSMTIVIVVSILLGITIMRSNDSQIFANNEDQIETISNEVTPEIDDFDFSGTTLTKIKNSYIASLSAEQKQNIRIVIPEGTEKIAENAFKQTNYKDCNFISLDLSKATRLVAIGNYAFYGNNKMEGILQLSSILDSIGQQAFDGCSSLSGDLILPDSLRTMGSYAFSNCKGMKGDLKLSENMTLIPNYAFKDSGFTGKLVIPYGVTTIGDSAFRQTSSYNGYEGLLTIPDSVTSIGTVAFSYQAGITDVNFSSVLKAIPNSMFKGAGLQGSLTIPEHIETIGTHAFSGTQLETIILPKRAINNGEEFVQSSSFGTGFSTGLVDYCPKLNAIISDKADYSAIYGSLHTKTRERLGYSMSIQFVNEKDEVIDTREGLFKQSYNLQDTGADIWGISEDYQFPKIENKGWGITKNAADPVQPSDKITQDKLYAIDVLENPSISYSEGIDKVYDGKFSDLSVQAKHPLAKPIGDANEGDVVFYYTWSWATIGTSDPVLAGFDKNVYRIKDVRVPGNAIIAKVTVQACVVRNNKAVEFYRENHNFPFYIRQATPIVTPIYSKDRMLVSQGMPEITTSVEDTKGVIKWSDNQEVKTGEHLYTWIFEPEKNELNVANYTTLEGSVTLHFVDKITHKITLSSEHGQIIMDSNEVDDGSDAVLKFQADRGYRLKSVLLDQKDITKDVVNDTYTIKDIRGNHSVQAYYEALTIEDVEDRIDNLPDVKEDEVNEEQRVSILETAKAYLELNEQSQIDISSVSKIQDALFALPQISIQVEEEQLSVLNARNLVETLSLEEINILLEYEDATFSVDVYAPLKTTTEEEKEAINNKLEGAIYVDAFDIYVEKTLTYDTETTATKITELRTPIQLKLKVPSSIPTRLDGYQRKMKMIRLHENGEELQSDVLYDEDNFEDTITIQSDQFSTYALVYQDVKQGEEVNSYVIQATAGDHGNISPRDMVKVSEGKHQVFTFKPDKGYQVAHVYVDGNDLGILDFYEFKNVREGHTIKVIFDKVSTIIKETPEINSNTPSTGQPDLIGSWAIVITLAFLIIVLSIVRLKINHTNV